MKHLEKNGRIVIQLTYYSNVWWIISQMPPPVNCYPVISLFGDLSLNFGRSLRPTTTHWGGKSRRKEDDSLINLSADTFA